MLLSLLVSATGLLASVVSAGLAFKGADISSLITLEGSGHSYKWTDGTSMKFENILAKAGANSARQLGQPIQWRV